MYGRTSIAAIEERRREVHCFDLERVGFVVEGLRIVLFENRHGCFEHEVARVRSEEFEVRW